MTEPEPMQLVGENEIRWRKRTLVHFSGCDYFRLGRNPKVARAAREALAKSGLNVSASRRTTGNNEIYARLETELAAFFGAEAAVAFPDGYLAPSAAAQALAGEFAHVFVDEFAHAALFDAARMLDCPIKKFKHRDVSDLARALSKLGRNARPIVLTDGMFSHDGSVAPLGEYLKILPKRGMILLDDAHGGGVLGAHGRGAVEHERVSRTRIIQCVTLSKAFGVYGGAVLASRLFREKIVARSRMFVGTTPLPPPLAGAALASLEILRRENFLRKKLFQNVAHLRAGLLEAGLEILATPGPIVRLPELKASAAGDLKKRLLASGIYPPFLKYGSTSATGYFRFVISSGHTRVQLDKLISVLKAFKSRRA